MFVVCIFFLVLAVNVDFSDSHKCETFNQVPMTLHTTNGQIFNKTVDGCIERIKFENDITVVKAYVENERVPHLWHDTVRNMKYLTKVSFVKCEVEGIHPTAFRNVPSLKIIQITKCKLKRVPKDVFTFTLTPELQMLYINDNQINLIEDQAFYNLTKLKQIDARRNKLETWRQEWFENATSLQRINFQENKFTSIPSRAFQNFPNIREIKFDYNEITEIHRHAFKDVRSLICLGLSHNKLKVLEEHSFPNTVRIDTFGIGGNYLNYLSNEVLKKLTAVKIIMDYNPWKCPCLDRIKYWLYIKNGKVSSEHCNDSNVPICAVPKDNPETCVDTVDDELTQRYLNKLRDIGAASVKACARLT